MRKSFSTSLLYFRRFVRFFKIFITLCIIIFTISICHSGFIDWFSSPKKDSYTNYSDYNYNNYYNNKNNYNFYPSKLSLTTFDVRGMFEHSFRYESTRNTWSMNYKYSENMDKYVAQNIAASDYCGYKIDNNIKWDNYSYFKGLYEPQIYSNVQMQSNDLKSFDMYTSIGLWTRRDHIDNIRYNDEGLPKSINFTTYDIAGNKFEQYATKMQYTENPQLQSYNNLLNICDKYSEQNNKYMYKELGEMIREQGEGAKYVVSAFDLRTIDEQGTITDISFKNIKWDNRGIIAFESVITGEGLDLINIKATNIFQGDGNFLGTNIKIETTEGTKELQWTKEMDISIGEMVDGYLRGRANPVELMGTARVQIGDARLSFLSVEYDDDGYLDNAVNTYDIDFNITTRENVSNILKLDLYEYNQTAEIITRDVLGGRDISDMNELELRDACNEISSRIEAILPLYEESKQIETSWGQELQVGLNFNLKLEGTQIKSDTTFSTQEGNTISDITFIINKKGNLEAVQGVIQDGTGEIRDIGKNYFKAPIIREEPAIQITPQMEKEMIKNQRNGLGHRTDKEIAEQFAYEIEIARREGNTGYIVFCFGGSKSIVAGELVGIGEQRGDIKYKFKDLLKEIISKQKISTTKEMVPMHVEILEQEKDGRMYSIGMSNNGLRKIEVEQLRNYYKDIEILKHEMWSDKLINDVISIKIYNKKTGQLRRDISYDYGRLLGYGDDDNRGRSKEICSELVYHIGRDYAKLMKETYNYNIHIFGTVEYDNIVSPWDMYSARDSWDDNIRDIYRRRKY